MAKNKRSLMTLLFGRDPDVVASIQEGRTARKQAQKANRTAVVEARQDPENVKTRSDAALHVYDKVHGSVSEVGSAILGMYGLDVKSEDERQMLLNQQQADLAAAAGLKTTPAPGTSAGMSKPMLYGLGVLGVLGLGYAATRSGS